MRSVLLITALCLLPGLATAQQIVSARAAGMGEASRGVGTTNDALLQNPAGMSLYPRYSLETFWRRDFKKKSSVFNLSILDSKSGPVGGGISYTYENVGEKGEVRSGSRVDLASSYRVADFLMFGATIRYVGLQTAEGDVNTVTGDTGFLLAIGSFLQLGMTVRNAFNPTNETNAEPRTVGGGVSMTFGGLLVAYDYRQNIDANRESLPNSHYAGAEYFFGGAFTLRAGWVSDQFLEEHRWTMGLGYVSPSWGLDVAYSNTIEKSPSPGRYLSFGFKMFL